MFGKLHSIQTKQKISEAKKGRPANKKGIPMSSESIAKRIASRKLNRELKLQAQQPIIDK